MLPETVSCRIDSKIFSHHSSHHGEIHALYRLWVNPDGTGKIDGNLSDEQFLSVIEWDLPLLVLADTQNIHLDDDLEAVKATSINLDTHTFTWIKIPYADLASTHL